MKLRRTKRQIEQARAEASVRKSQADTSDTSGTLDVLRNPNVELPKPESTAALTAYQRELSELSRSRTPDPTRAGERYACGVHKWWGDPNKPTPPNGFGCPLCKAEQEAPKQTTGDYFSD